MALAGLLIMPISASAQVSPLMGIANVQFFGNDGLPLTNGCLYVYAAGTSTQAASYSDSAGTQLNTNPVCFGLGARATVWLTTANFFKLQLCSANDGAFCSAGDLLFSVDNLPGGASSSGGGASCGTGCTGFFVSGTASPATSGVLRMGSGDSFGWRNAAGSANLLFSKDANDLLSWPTPLKFPENGGATGVAGFDLLWADNSVHRWKMANNGGTSDTVSGAATIDTFTNKTFDAQGSGNNFKIGGTSISNTGQSATTFLRGDGTWGGAVSESIVSGTVTSGVCGSGSPSNCAAFFIPANAHTLTRLVSVVTTAGVGCSVNSQWAIIDITNSNAVLASGTPNNTVGTISDSGALSVAMTAAHRFALGQANNPTGCTTFEAAILSATYQ